MRHLISMGIVALALSPALGSAQTVDTISAGKRRFDRLPRIGVDTLDGFAVVGDSSRLTYTMIRSVRRGDNGTLIVDTRIGPVRYSAKYKLAPFTPLEFKSTSPRDSAAATFQGEFVQGWVVEAGKTQDAVEHEFADDIVPFASGASEILAQIVPLADGYSAAFRVFDPYQNKGEWWSLRVLGSETLAHRGKSVDCWIVETTIPGASPAPTHRQWIAKTNRLVIQDRNMREFPDGRTMIARAR
jgi:hypothetical protein